MKTTVQLSDRFDYRRLLCFVLPSIVMMVFTSIYGVVDGLFVSNYVGKTPFAAINLVMPFVMIFGGIGFMFGTGGSALVAKTLGEGDSDRANRYFSMMIIVTLAVGIATSVLGIVFMRPIAVWLGADETMIESSVLYGRIVIGFNVAFMLQNVFQSFLVAAQKPKLGLAATVAAGLTNMVLDALFIAVFDWGVAGAAIATGLSECVGGLFPLIYFLCPNGSLLRLRKASIEPRMVLAACWNGASELVSSVTSSVVGMLYNFQLLRYAGENGVAAYGVLMYLDFVFVAIFIGYAVGSAPLVSYNYGAQNHAELQNLRRKSIRLNAIAGVCMVALSQLIAPVLVRIFVGYDAELSAMSVHALRIFSIAYLFIGFNIFSSSFFTALNNGGVSAAISFLRTFIFKLSAVLLLPLAFGLDGIWWASICAEIIAFCISAAFLIAKRKKYNY